jgi:formate/nitrite transporter FocA (FNT family)
MDAHSASRQKESEMTRLVGGFIAVVSIGAGLLVMLVLPMDNTSLGSIGYILSASLFLVGLSVFIVGQVQIWRRKNPK